MRGRGSSSESWRASRMSDTMNLDILKSWPEVARLSQPLPTVRWLVAVRLPIHRASVVPVAKQTAERRSRSVGRQGRTHTYRHQAAVGPGGREDARTSAVRGAAAAHLQRADPRQRIRPLPRNSNLRGRPRAVSRHPDFPAAEPPVTPLPAACDGWTLRVTRRQHSRSGKCCLRRA